MKKRTITLILILIVLLISVGIYLWATHKEVLLMRCPYCAESDGGVNYFIRATTTGVGMQQANSTPQFPEDTSVAQVKDEQLPPSAEPADQSGQIYQQIQQSPPGFLSGQATSGFCSGLTSYTDNCTTSTILREYSCSGDYVFYTDYDCGPLGCLNGACGCSDDANCTLSPYQCINGYCAKSICGDGILRDPNGNGEPEFCDDGSLNAVTCPAPYGGSCSFCNLTCGQETKQGESCGDGILNLTYEECDDEMNNTDNPSPPGYNETLIYCNTTCKSNTLKGESCGDGILNLTYEECDNGINNQDTCDPSPTGSCNYCSTSCINVTRLAGVETCGNGICNTSFGETCSTCSTDCGACNPGGGSPGGGSGSGGSTRTIPKPQNQNNDLVIVPSELTLSIVRDVPVDQEFTIFNSGTKEIKLTFSTDQLENFITFDQNPITLSPGEEKVLKIKILVNKGNQVIAGKIIISLDSGPIKEIPIVLNSRSKDFIFDAKIQIPPSFKKISSGTPLQADVILSQVGEPKKIDVVATYEIKDFSGNSYSVAQETFSVNGEKKFTKEFATSTLPIGNYVLGLDLTYPGAFAVSSDQFEIVQQTENSKTVQIIVPIIFISLLALVVLFVLFKNKKNKLPKKHKNTKHK
jgi:hypothetical protein